MYQLEDRVLECIYYHNQVFHQCDQLPSPRCYKIETKIPAKEDVLVCYSQVQPGQWKAAFSWLLYKLQSSFFSELRMLIIISYWLLKIRDVWSSPWSNQLSCTNFCWLFLINTTASLAVAIFFYRYSVKEHYLAVPTSQYLRCLALLSVSLELFGVQSKAVNSSTFCVSTSSSVFATFSLVLNNAVQLKQGSSAFGAFKVFSAGWSKLYQSTKGCKFLPRFEESWG